MCVALLNCSSNDPHVFVFIYPMATHTLRSSASLFFFISFFYHVNQRNLKMKTRSKKVKKQAKNKLSRKMVKTKETAKCYLQNRIVVVYAKLKCLQTNTKREMRFHVALQLFHSRCWCACVCVFSSRIFLSSPMRFCNCFFFIVWFSLPHVCATKENFKQISEFQKSKPNRSGISFLIVSLSRSLDLFFFFYLFSWFGKGNIRLLLGGFCWSSCDSLGMLRWVERIYECGDPRNLKCYWT